jgi:hypothetical protein
MFSKPILERVTSSLDVNIPLEDCRYFEGYSFHDPLFKNLYGWQALVLSWPPFDDQHRVALAFSARKKEVWRVVFKAAGIPRDLSRVRRERGIFLAAIILGGALAAGLTVLALSAVNAVVRPAGNGMPVFVSATIAFLWGAFLTRLTARGAFGDFVGHLPLAQWIGPAVGITIFLVLPLARGRDPGDVDAAFRALLVSALFSTIIWIVHRRFRKREIRLLEQFPEAVELDS